MALVDSPKIRIIAVGDGAVGKTCLLVRYAEDTFETEHNVTPNTLTKTSVNQHFEGTEYQLELIDTAGQEDFERTSTQHYNSVDVFLVCYSIDNKKSFKNVPRKVERN